MNVFELRDQPNAVIYVDGPPHDTAHQIRDERATDTPCGRLLFRY